MGQKREHEPRWRMGQKRGLGQVERLDEPRRPEACRAAIPRPWAVRMGQQRTWAKWDAERAPVWVARPSPRLLWLPTGAQRPRRW